MRLEYRGRGATLNPAGRFEPTHTSAVDEIATADWFEFPIRIQTEVMADTSKSILAFNDSPDIPFDQSINVYRGCEHGCVYCYARPSHNYLGLSSGVDFETKIFAKHNAPELLRRALTSKHYHCRPLALGANTDPYQPTERRLQITRRVLELLAQCKHPLSIVTKSSLVLRDRDILERLAQENLVTVYLSVTTLDSDLARKMEPRASAPHLRLKALRDLSRAGIPTGVMMAPVIPALNDGDIEGILEQAASAGTKCANYTILRLSHDLKVLFEDWLDTHYPMKKKRILSLLKQMREGRLNDPAFGRRMTGTGAFAELTAARFRRACSRHGLGERDLSQRTDLFDPSLLRSQLQLNL